MRVLTRAVVPSAGSRRRLGTCALLALTCASVVPQAAQAAVARVVDAKDGQWAPLRTKPNAHVIANLPAGTPVTVQRTARGGRWSIGRAGGAIAHCGVVRSSHLRGRGRVPAGGGCPASLPYRAFSNGVRNAFPKQADGAQARVLSGPGCAPSDVVGWGNVSPWLRRSRPADVFGAIAEGTAVHWRYASRDGAYAMVWAPGVLAQSPWFFVKAACLLNARSPSCAPSMPRCDPRVGQRRPGSNFTTGQTFPTAATLLLGATTDEMLFVATARCMESPNGAPAILHMPGVELRKDGSFEATDGDAAVAGRFTPGGATVTFRRAFRGCDTGPVTLTLYMDRG